jgi:hypothetical protein
VKVPQHVMLRSVVKNSIIIIYKISPQIIDFLIEIIPHWEVTLKAGTITKAVSPTLFEYREEYSKGLTKTKLYGKHVVQQ